MTDLLHQELEIGDWVVGHRVGSSYKGIRILRIISFTPKLVRTEQGLHSSNDLVKINLQYEHAKSLNPEHFI